MLRIAMKSLANYYKPSPIIESMQFSNKNHKRLLPNARQAEKIHQSKTIKIGLLKNSSPLFPGASNLPLGMDIKELLSKEGKFDKIGYQFCPNNSYSRVVYKIARHENSLKILDERYRLFDINSGTSIQKATKIKCDTTSIANLKQILTKVEGLTASQSLATRINELKVQLYGANPSDTKLLGSISKEIRYLMETIISQNLNRVHNFPEFNQQLIRYIEEESYLEQTTKAVKIIENAQSINKEFNSIFTQLETKYSEKSKHDVQKYVAQFFKTDGASTNTNANAKLINELNSIKNIPQASKDIVLQEIKNSESEQSADKNKTLEYIDHILKLPWDKSSAPFWDIEYAQKCLDESHYGLKETKERIIQFISKYKVCKSDSGIVLLLNGPPGVGKTSIAKSIAKSLKRPYALVSLAGIDDANHIKGYRRAYVGSLPGIFIKEMEKLGVNNPVFIVDEIDKVSTRTYRESVSDSLLEILNMEQNSEFTDYYLDIPFDFSKCMFICICNSTRSMLTPLLDRIEKITIDPYLPEEKKLIAKNFLIPSVLKEFKAATDLPLKFTQQAIDTLIYQYTLSEAGVRNLRKLLNRIVGKIIYQIETKKIIPSPEQPMLITSQNVHEFLQNYTSEDSHYYKHIKEIQPVGCTHTISSEYEEMANILKVQIVREQYVKENYGIKIIGSVGPVLKESIDLVKSVVGNFIVNKLGTTNIFEKPLVLSFSFPGDKKNSASIGASIFASFVSLITNTPVHQGMSIVGEVDLNGNILKIDGLRERVIACKSHGLMYMVVPRANKPTIEAIQPEYLEGITICYASNIDDVYNFAFNSFQESPQCVKYKEPSVPKVKEETYSNNFIEKLIEHVRQ